MKKDNFAYDFMSAINVLIGEWLKIDCSSLSDEEERKQAYRVVVEISRLKSDYNPEERCILKDAYERMSSSSREAYMIIIMNPDELAEKIATKVKKKITQKKFMDYLQDRDFDLPSIMGEIKEFLKTWRDVENEKNKRPY